MIITDDIEEIAIMKHRFDSFEHEMNATASKVAVVNQLARQLLQIEHPGAAEVISRQNQLNGRSVKKREKSDACPEFFKMLVIEISNDYILYCGVEWA